MSNKFAGGIKAGSLDVSIPVKVRRTDNLLGKTGLLAADVTVQYWRQGSTPQSVTESDLGTVDAAHSDGGWIEVDATDQPGTYRLDLPDAAFAAGADWVDVAVSGTGFYSFDREYPLESQGAAENYAELTDADYGLGQLVRSATPANELAIETDGMAHADLKEWLGSAPNTLSSGRVQTEVGLFLAQAKAEILVEVNSALDAAIAELTGVPSATPSMRTVLMLLYHQARNKFTASDTEAKLRNSAGSVVMKAVLTEDGTEFTRGKLTAP
jgi:hypothetical protein